MSEHGEKHPILSMNETIFDDFFSPKMEFYVTWRIKLTLLIKIVKCFKVDFLPTDFKTIEKTKNYNPAKPFEKPKIKMETKTTTHLQFKACFQ